MAGIARIPYVGDASDGLVGDVRYFPVGSPPDSAWVRADGSRLTRDSNPVLADLPLCPGFSRAGVVNDSDGTLGVTTSQRNSRVVGGDLFTVSNTDLIKKAGVTGAYASVVNAGTLTSNGGGFMSEYLGEANGFHFVLATASTTGIYRVTTAGSWNNGGNINSLVGAYTFYNIYYSPSFPGAPAYLLTCSNGIYSSADGLTGWTQRSTIPARHLIFIGSAIYAAYDDNTWTKSTNGGQTWSAKATPTGFTSFGPAFGRTPYVVYDTTTAKFWCAVVDTSGNYKVYSCADPTTSNWTQEFTVAGSPLGGAGYGAGVVTARGYILFAFNARVIWRRPNGAFGISGTLATLLDPGASGVPYREVRALPLADGRLWVLGPSTVAAFIYMDVDHEFAGPTLSDIVGSDAVTYNAYVRGRQ